MNYTQLKKIYLAGYRTVGFIFLTTITTALVGYGAMMVFFLFSSTWIAPTVMSQTSDKMLQFASGYLNATQQQATSEIAFNQAKRQVEVLTEHRTALVDILKQSGTAVKVETHATSQTISIAGKLMSAKAADIAASKKLQDEMATLKLQTEKSLAAGLITRDVAAQTFAAIQGFNNAVTDSRASLLSLDQQTGALSRNRETLLGTPASVDAMVAVKAYSDVKQQLLQAESELKTAEETVISAGKQLGIANGILENLKETSYMAAMNKGANLAFIPYDNDKIAKVGEPVYDCYLLIAVCHKVGVIKHIYHDEQLVDFPIFNVRLSRTVRGFMVDLDMSDPKAMTSIILFVNKPVFF